MITNMSSLCKNTLTYLSTICKYHSTSSSSSYVCTCRHVGNSQKRCDIYGAKNGEKWQMLPNVGPTFSDISPTCRPTCQCCVKVADANIRQTQLSSVASLSVIAITIALAVGHCRLCHCQPSQSPSLWAITVAITIGHC
jgi:hypothetical protein